MKKVPRLFYYIVMFILLSCNKSKNNVEDQSGPSEITQTIANVLNTTDSLKQFAQLFQKLSLTTADVNGGITVLALTNNALVNPSDPNNLKDYIIKGLISPASLTNGSALNSITGKQILITVQNGQTYANGVMISTSSVTTSAKYNVYAIAGMYNHSNNGAYDDPHKNEYYIEYYENGVYHSLGGRNITSWQFFSFDHFPTPYVGNCSYPSYDSYSSGPAQALVAFAAEEPFWLQVNRKDFTAKPIVKEYLISASTYNTSQNINNGNCNLVINGAVFSCDPGDKDSYVRVNITEVKVDQDLGIEKRGYYKGTFDAILYYTSHARATPEKRVITGGRFMAPMGGNEISPINGTAPALDRLAMLTAGKWYFRPYVEECLSSPNGDCANCNLDDYMVFRTNGTCDIKDGGIQCQQHEGGIDYGDNITWAFKDNQTVISFQDTDYPINEISDSTLVFGGIKLTHGN